MLLSVVSAVAASFSLDTYTARTPKRLFIQHIIRDTNTEQPYSVYAAASSDATPIDVALTGMNLTSAELNGREWLVSIFAGVASACIHFQQLGFTCFPSFRLGKPEACICEVKMLSSNKFFHSDQAAWHLFAS